MNEMSCREELEKKLSTAVQLLPEIFNNTTFDNQNVLGLLPDETLGSVAHVKGIFFFN